MPGTTVGFTLIVILLLVAVGTVAQAALDVSTTLTTSPLFSAASEYVLLFVPTLIPFFFHWYIGAVPVLTADAVNVAWVDAQIVVDVVATLTEGVTGGVDTTESVDGALVPQLAIAATDTWPLPDPTV